MRTIDRVKLCVAEITGTPYLSTLDKDGNMTETRRELDRNEVLAFICHWALAEQDNTNSNEINITKGKKTVLTITIHPEKGNKKKNQ